MKITQTASKDLVVTISVEVKAKDYNEKVENSLKDYRKTAQIPGFRKGKTPMGIINKKYRKSVVADEVYKLIQDELYKYIKEGKAKFLGSPIPVDNSSIDWDKEHDFIFKYEIGLAPDFDVEITKKDKLNYYKIKADSKLVETYCHDIAKRYGKMSTPEVSIDGDLIFCSIEQLDKEGNLMPNGIKNDATVSPDYITDKNIKKQFTGLKKNDTLNLNVVKAFNNHTDLAAMLNIESTIINSLASEHFRFTVKNINRLEPADLNKELFDKVYQKGSVKTLKTFKERIKSEAESQFVAESDRMLKSDVVTYFVDKLKLKLPDEFLKRWLIQNSEKPITMEMLDKEYVMYSKSLQWQLIENKILERFNIKVEQEDVLTHTKKLISMQMKQYGQPEGDDAQLTDIAINVIKNEKERKKIYDQIFDERTLSVYKENFKLTEKSISYDDFVKLASKKQ